MEPDPVNRLVDLWLNDAAFRASLHADPEGTLSRKRIALDDAEWATVRNVVHALAGAQLKERIGMVFL